MTVIVTDSDFGLALARVMGVKVYGPAGLDGLLGEQRLVDTKELKEASEPPATVIVYGGRAPKNAQRPIGGGLLSEQAAWCENLPKFARALQLDPVTVLAEGTPTEVAESLSGLGFDDSELLLYGDGRADWGMLPVGSAKRPLARMAIEEPKAKVRVTAWQPHVRIHECVWWTGGQFVGATGVMHNEAGGISWRKARMMARWDGLRFALVEAGYRGPICAELILAGQGAHLSRLIFGMPSFPVTVGCHAVLNDPRAWYTSGFGSGMKEGFAAWVNVVQLAEKRVPLSIPSDLGQWWLRDVSMAIDGLECGTRIGTIPMVEDDPLSAAKKAADKARSAKCMDRSIASHMVDMLALELRTFASKLR